MFKSKHLGGAVALAIGAMIALPGVVSAAKKLTYEQAWAQCKKELDAAGVFGVGFDAKARSTAGGACMKKHGYRLKKGTM